jgi:hypothetical protein
MGLWESSIMITPPRCVEAQNRIGHTITRGDAGARAKVAQVLDRARLNMDDAMAQTLQQNLDTVERVDRMLVNAEARRNNALREIDRHRENFATAIRGIVDVEDETSQRRESRPRYSARFVSSGLHFGETNPTMSPAKATTATGSGHTGAK